MKYKYKVEGTATNEQTWWIAGEKECMPGDFAKLPEIILRETFRVLTSGKAVYGKPGVGCSGPYSIKKFLIEG